MSDTWQVGSGSWTTPGNWSAGEPTTTSDATFTGDLALTVSYASTSTIAALVNLSDTSATLDLTSGTLVLTDGGEWVGTIDQTGAVLDVTSQQFTVGGKLVMGAASDTIDGGATLLLEGGGTIRGTIAGQGTLSLDGSGAAYTIDASTALDVGAIVIADPNGTVSLSSNETVAGGFSLYAGAIALDGKALVLTGASDLSGLVDGPGTVDVAAAGTVNAATFSGGAVLNDTGFLVETGNQLALGAGTADTAELLVAHGATYDLLYDSGIVSSGTATMSNAGLFEKAGDTGSSIVTADFVNTGTIAVNQGTLSLGGTVNTLGGTIEGAGAVEIHGGGTTTLSASTTLTVGGFTLDGYQTVLKVSSNETYAGAFNLDGGTIALATKAFTLSGASFLDGEALGAGTLSVTGSAQVYNLLVSGGAVLLDNGTITEAAVALQLGGGTADTATLSIDAGRTYDLLGDVGINADGTAAADNAGLLEKTGGTAASAIDASLDTTGILDTVQGTISLQGGGEIGGVVNGAGEVDLRSGAAYTLESSLSLRVAAVGIYDSATQVTLDAALSYGGALTLGGGASIDLDGHALTLTAAAVLDGTVSGGTVDADKSAGVGGLVLTGGAVLDDLGVVTQTNAITVGAGTADTASISIGSGHTYDIVSDSNINANGTAGIANAGLFEKTAAFGTSTVGADVTSTGTIDAAEGVLALTGAADSLGGTITGAGELDLRGGAQFTIDSGAVLSVATLGVYDNGTGVTLDGSHTYSGDLSLGGGAALDLAGTTLTLAGTGALDGEVNGAGTLVVQGSADTARLVIGNGAEVEVTGTLTQDDFDTIGTSSSDSGKLAIAAGGTYDILIDNNINAQGTAAITNAGLFEKTAGTGITSIYAELTNTGTLAVDLGTVALLGPSSSLGGSLTGSGVLEFYEGTESLLAGVAVSVASWDITAGAAATLDGNLTYDGSFSLTGAEVALGGHALTLKGSDVLQGGVSGPGSVVIDGSAEIAGQSLTDGALLLDAGTVVEDRFVSLGSSATDTANISITAAGTWELESNDAITQYGTGSLANAGLFEKLGPDGTSTVAINFVNTGKVAADSGTIRFTDDLTNDATITATGASIVVAGSIAADAGKHGTFDIGANGAVEFDSVAVGTDQAAAFTTTSGTLRLYQPGSFDGTITGFRSGDTIDLGDIAVNGVAYSGSNLVLTNTVNGTVVADYTLDAPGITTPGSLELIGDNAGGTEIVLNHSGPHFTDPAGAINTDDWNADAPGAFTSGANWTEVVNGITSHPEPRAGDDAEILPNGTTPFKVSYDTTDTVNALDADSYATLDMTGGTLTVNQGGDWSGSFDIAGGTFDAVDGYSASGPATLAASAHEEVDANTLSVGGGSLAGTVTGAGQYLLIGGYDFTIDHGFVITAGTWDLGVNDDGFGSNTTLDETLGYAGRFILTDYNGNSANLYLDKNTLALTGPTNLNGYISGSGTLNLRGSTEIGLLTVNNSATVNLSTVATQDGAFTLGSVVTTDTTTFNVLSSGTYDLTTNDGIGEYGATLDNSGLIEKTGGTGQSTIGYDGGQFVDTGSIQIGIGALGIGFATNTLDGAITGPGTLVLLGGDNFTIESGASIATGAWYLAVNSDGFGSSTTLDTNLSYGGTFGLDNYNGNPASLLLNGHTLTLTGHSNLNGNVNGTGTLALGGSAEISGLSIQNGATVNVSGTVTQDGLVSYGAGTGTAALNVLAGATYDLVNSPSVNDNGSADFDNAGLLEKTGNDGTSYLYAGQFTNTGTVLIDSGLLLIDGSTSSIGGTYTGAGTLGLLVSSFTLDAGATISTAGFALYLNGDGFGASLTLDTNLAYGGSFGLYDYSGNNTTLLLNGYTATLSGFAYLNGSIIGPGTLDLAGTADIVGDYSTGSPVIEDTKLVQSTGNLGMNGGTVSIAAHAIWNVQADGQDISGADAITNAGLLEKTSGTGTSYFAGDFTNTGTISVTTGAIAIQGGSNTLGGVVEGGGALYIETGGTTTLQSDLSLSVGTLGLYDGGVVVLGANLADTHVLIDDGDSVALGGYTLTLSATDILSGAIDGPGEAVIAASHQTALDGLTLGGTTTLSVLGTATDNGVLYFGTTSTDLTTLSVGTGGTFDIDADQGSGEQGQGSVVNAGLLERTGADGTSVLDATLLNTGTVLVDAGTLDFQFGANGSIGGTLSGTGVIGFNDGGTETLQSGAVLDVATLSVYNTTFDLAAGDTDHGALSLLSSTFGLDGETFIADGATTLSSSVVEGGGTLALNGTGTIYFPTIGGGATLTNAGTIFQTGGLTLGDSNGGAAVVNSGTYDFVNDGGISTQGSGTTIFTNDKLLEKTAGDGVSAIVSNFVNASGGTIDAQVGTIVLSGATVDLAGTVAGAGMLDVNTVATITAGLALGTSAVEFLGGVQNNGTITEGGTLFVGGTLAGAGTLDIAAHGLTTIGDVAAAGSNVAFTAATGTLAIAFGTLFAGTIHGLAAGDTIDLTGQPTSSISGLAYAGGELMVSLAGGGGFNLAVAGSFTTGSFHTANDGHNGTAITVT